MMKPPGNTCIIKKAGLYINSCSKYITIYLKADRLFAPLFPVESFSKANAQVVKKLMSLCCSCLVMGLSFMPVEFSEQHVNEQLTVAVIAITFRRVT